ncbi:RNA polymerase sigma-70 factor (sigma-E family) [Kitasatospora sp. SolWspMP-SS2h]|uniref:SigE family RNA polymerase sigma factor n=1 Tax=Kitasatospora sp. SolWspMP-SS2h TaxID=1305729 RepID=UPI000DB93C61|nr:SigE family RNA polymerase sigma factor [Kitasatospora sp. SolWspMP-SS2h]RAJ46242.1 RNA polymerase sigma-70 factor (sigma-E family) [Kitasatospora sp. SolWspMP-SS2h]
MTEGLDFDEFAAGRARRLFHLAYLMCGDWHQAQDLVQTALSKLYPVWGRLQRGDGAAGIDAYARKVLLRCYLSHRRLRRSSELAVDEFPEEPSIGAREGSSAALRITLVAALRQLPPRNRAVVVLRYLEDYSLEETAEAMGITVSAVKSLNSRSMARLRTILGPDRALLLQD